MSLIAILDKCGLREKAECFDIESGNLVGRVPKSAVHNDRLPSWKSLVGLQSGDNEIFSVADKKAPAPSPAGYAVDSTRYELSRLGVKVGQ